MLLSLAAGIFISCSGEKEPDQDPSLYVKDTAKTTETITAAPSNTITGNSLVPQTPGQVTVNQMPAQTVSQVTAATAPGMNPPHGQPGHRCDIAVGAPLNSAPTTPATQTAAPVITQTVTPQKSTVKTITAPGMNPPHGEPGHRCDIAVGAPLNSAPTKPAAPAGTPAISPVIVPAEAPKKDSAGG